ncbi:cysteine hydrolase family protein [Nitrosomonas aestuarii]|uniref:cysteine hydrolase family protein n=1 Tax=Nitrosomonas aestuarii TaxID=52441 RepID=UPI000D2F9329|nr:isochorismatase family cysteine hydrolase [Nitrosomonas aestuarii]PTN07397.1 nicotinamidase-related amidase [Nitrosomonas aestuarii]
MNKYTDPHIEKSALITIDTQNDFTLNNAPARIDGTASIVPNMVRLVTAYRKQGLPIIHVVRLYLKDGSNVDLCRKQAIEEGKEIVAPDSSGAELVDELKPDPDLKLDAGLLLSGNMQKLKNNEYVIYKPRWGAFYKTMLESFLKEREIDTVVFSGCNFPNCPRTSIYQASERDFRIVLVKDAISRLYQIGEEEMQNIDVSLLETNDIENLLAKFLY